MVLCKFFQQGNCRFGSKCANEHFDVKQIIKTDVETAVNGKQWPFSCYGPFKDKPCIPNFIEDQSFEEIRLLCYDAKQKNFFEQFHQQFKKEALEASSKMKALLQMTPDIVEVVTKVYDSPVDGRSGAAPPKSSNPFGLSSAVAAASDGSSSIFGKSAAASTGNIFGGASGGFANAGGNIFGGALSSNQATSNIFGGSPGFGGLTQQQQPQQQTSIFGQGAPKAVNPIFGGATAAVPSQSSMFGQAQQQTAPPTGLFAQAAQQAATNSFGLFSQAAQQAPAAQQQSIFGQQQQPQQQLQAANPFGQTMQQSVQPQGLFAQAAAGTTPQQIQSGAGFFPQAGQQQQQAAGGGQPLFAAATAPTQNLFAQAEQHPQTQSSQAMDSNVFAQSAGEAQSQPQTQIQSAPGGLFQQAAKPPPAFPQPPQDAGSGSSMSSTAYSRMEDLTAEEIEAFKADCFVPGKIPFSPPPRELVN